MNYYDIIKHFLKYAVKELKLNELPSGLTLSHNNNKAKTNHTFGTFTPDNNKIWVYVKNRNMADILRTLAHELVHRKQAEDGRLEPNSGETGSNIENEANAMAGVLLRKFGKNNENIYEVKKNFINEIGDKPLSWKFKFGDEDEAYYEFNTPKYKYAVGFSLTEDEINSEFKSFDMLFTPVESKGLDTNEGKMLQIMATSADIARDFVSKYEPDELTIHPITRESGDDPKRSRIYGYYLEKNIPKEKYSLIKIGNSYRVIKK